MTRFNYQARDSHGGILNGVLNAADIGEATRQLRGEGHVILDIHEQTGPVRATAVPTVRTKAKKDDVVAFANQLAVMVDTGVPLAQGLDSIAEQTDNDSFQPVLESLSEQVKSGIEFSTALARYPRIFDQLFISMVRASEASGTMGTMLQRVARYLQKQRLVRRQVKGAMAYPMAMLGFCVLVVVGMLTFILPRFEKIYMGKSAALPGPTRFLLALSGAIINYWPFILAGAAVAGTGLYLYLRSPGGRSFLDALRLQVPVLGPMFRRASLARSLRTFATMISTGVNMLESLEIAGAVAGNVHYAAVWQDLSERVRQGATLSEEMLHCDRIPRSISQMVAAGEQAGKLGSVLDRVAGFCEEDLDTSVKAATSFIEPVMIVIMGAIVGGISLALLLPVFTLSKVVGH